MSGSFTFDLTKKINRAKVSMNAVVQKVTYTIFRSVILKTPVDTGRVKGNWVTSAGSYERAAVLTKDKTKRGGRTIDDMANVVLKTPAGGIVYMVNNVAYLQYLEYGRDDGQPGSKQAPQGMIRITLLEYHNYLTKAIKEAK